MNFAFAFGALSTAVLSAETQGTSPLAMTPAKLDQPQVVCKLPAVFDDVCVGGSGRFLIFSLKSLSKLAVFDLCEAKVVGYVPTGDSEILFAAGADRLLVVYPDKMIVRRYRLDTLKLETTQQLAVDGRIALIAMGAASQGPLLIGTGESFHTSKLCLLDIKTLKPLDWKMPPQLRVEMGPKTRVRASANGRVFGFWRIDVSPSGVQTLVLGGKQVECFYEHASAGYVFPDQNGERVYTTSGVFTNHAQRRDASEANQRETGFPIPAVHGPFYVRIAATDSSRANPRRNRKEEGQSAATPSGATVSVYLAGETKPLATLEGVAIQADNFRDRFAKETISIDKRIYLVPGAQVLATLPEGQDSVVLRRFDLEEELKKSGTDYLVVLSQPPTSVSVGETFQYQLDVKTRGGKLTYSLDSGPEGMAISKSGLVRWQVKQRPEDESNSVIITVTSESGQTSLHSFNLAVEGPAGRPLATGPTVADETKRQPAESDEPATTPPSIARAYALAPAKLNEKQVTRKLPANFDDVCAAGGGRYLVLSLKSLSKLAVFDLCEAKVAGYVPTGGGDVLFAAGKEHLVIIHPDKRVIQRYRLDTLASEVARPLNVQGNVQSMAMGAASTGPLLLMTAAEPFAKPVFLDVKTLKPLPYRIPDQLLMTMHGRAEPRASADGRVFVVRHGTGMTVLRILGDQLDGTWGHESPIYACPDESGERIYGGGVVYDHQAKPLGTRDEMRSANMLLPAVQGAFYLRIPQGNPGNSRDKPGPVTVHLAGATQPLVVLPDLAPQCVWPRNVGNRMEIGVDKCVYLVPAAEVIAVLPSTRDAVILNRFNIEEELKASGVDYLVVVSQPPRAAHVGESFEYQLDIRSKAGGVACTLDSGPQGMTLSKAGKVRWSIKSRPVGGAAKVVISLNDSSGQTALHAFDLAVERGDAVASEPSTGSGRRPGGSGSAAGDGGYVKIDAHRLELPHGDFVVGPGRRGQSMLLLQGNRVVRLAPDGITPQKQVKLETPYVRIAERADYFVALAAQPAVVDLIDKKTLTVKRHVAIGKGKAIDMAVHPAKPLCYVSFSHSFDIPSCAFVVVDEQTGKIRESEEYVGAWLQVDPSGRCLVTGYHDIYRSGSRLLVNPGRVHVLPEYGDLNWMIYYSLSRDGTPSFKALNRKPGSGAGGLRMSSDGRRVNYLSGGNMTAWNPAKLDEAPVTYTIEGPRQASDLAFHPVLPLVACIGPSLPLLFDRETGEPASGCLDLAADDLGGSKIHRLWFSADGKNLILDTSLNEVHYLYQARLKLKTGESAKIDSRLAQQAADSVAAPAAGQGQTSATLVPLAQLDALKGGQVHDMTAKEIAQSFTDSVVVVGTGDGSGSGFVVGNAGYILTCEHCVNGGDDISVSYRVKVGEKVETKTSAAKVVRTDPQADLALLKIDSSTLLRAVRLAVGREVQSGERVTVIGNPGLGKTILDSTVTDGIVSNARRSLAGQTYVQTSAAVNPGCSGGPMFAGNGLVIGLVALKARIEGAGFAVPAEELAAFLLSAAKTTGPEAAIERVWYDAGETHRVDAQYVALQDDAVRLRREGKEYVVPLKRLSTQDQAFLRLLRPTQTKDK